MTDYKQFQVNHNLQQSNDFYLIIESDDRMKVRDVVFRLKNFPIPDITIPRVDVPTTVQNIPFPSQGNLEYGDLTLEMLVDDNLNKGFSEEISNIQILCSACHNLKLWVKIYITTHLQGGSKINDN